MNGTINKVILVGRIGDTIKLTYFSATSCLGQFPLATDDEYVNKTTNERISSTEWHNIVVRNKLAELIEKYTRKGDLIYVEGKIKTRKWQADDGSIRHTTEIHASDVTFLPNKREGQGKAAATAPAPHPTTEVTTEPPF
jgi:single-strand binding protein